MMKMMGGGGGIAEMMMGCVVSDQPKTTTLLHLFPASKKGKKVSIFVCKTFLCLKIIHHQRSVALPSLLVPLLHISLLSYYGYSCPLFVVTDNNVSLARLTISSGCGSSIRTVRKMWHHYYVWCSLCTPQWLLISLQRT
jgi:hypothetical protein